MRWRNPFFVQIEQLQSRISARSPVTRKRTRPQWQPPSKVSSNSASTGNGRPEAARRSLQGRWERGLFLFLFGLLGAPAQRRAEDVSEARARIGRAILGHRLLLFLDLAGLDRQRHLA